MSARPELAPVWRFLRSDGSVIAPALRLLSGGRIEGHDDPNEASWKVEDGHVHLVSRSAETSVVFDRVDRLEAGRVRLRGRVRRAGCEGVEQLLEQAPSYAADAVGVRELVNIRPRWLELSASSRVRALLERGKVHFGVRPRLRDHDVLLIGLHARIEPYISFSAGTALCTMGAFSYSESPLPPDLEIGRYCSIAIGLDVLRDRHPMEWATTSAITYGADPVHGYPSLAAAHAVFNPEGFDAEQPPGLFAPAPKIGHDVWIGQHVQLARGITIGHGAVIGAGSIVTRDVPPYAIVAGVPARVIRMRFEAPVIQALSDSRWWEFDASVVKSCDYRDPRRFAEQAAHLPDSDRWRPEATTLAAMLDRLRG